MSYNPRDEIVNELNSEIRELLGGWITQIEINCNGEKEEISCSPFNAYNKGCDEIILFNTTNDFDKVMNYINDDSQEKFRLNPNRLLVANRKNLEMRFKIN